MDPEERNIMQITLEDAVEADEIFTTLMGERWSRDEGSSKKTPSPYPTWTSDTGPREQF